MIEWGYGGPAGAAEPKQEMIEMSETFAAAAPVAAAAAPKGEVTADSKSKLHPCACSAWELVIEPGTDESGFEDYRGESIDCTRQTKRTFAQGHDAALKSLFIRAGVEGYDLALFDGPMRSDMDWQTAAAKYGFGYQVEEAVKARLAKAATKADRKAAKSASKAKTRKTVVENAAQPVKIKVGRWTYDATEVPGGYRYAAANGAERFVPAEKAKLI